MKLIKAATDFPSPYELEIYSEEEIEIIKEALDSYHDHLIVTNKDFHKDETLTTKLIKIEEMRQELEIPGYEWS